MQNPDITILVVTYNPDQIKLYRTLYSALRQKKISYEIIVTDDGSDFFDANGIEEYLLNRGFSDFSIISSETNLGTVKNLQKGLHAAKGRYVYSISPGDYFFGDSALCELYEYAQKNNLESVFGVPVLYSCETNNDEATFFSNFIPILPDLYNWNAFKRYFSKASVLYGNNPIGASFLRKREHYIKYIDIIANKIKYLEDKPISMFSLYEGSKIAYLNKPVVWYEYGTGISSSGNTRWLEKLKADNDVLGKMLLDRYPNVRLLCAKYKSEKYKRIRYPEVLFVVSVFSLISFLSKIKKHIIRGKRNDDLYNILENWNH